MGFKILFVCFALFFAQPSEAQIPVDESGGTGRPQVGEKAASKYMTQKPSGSVSSAEDHYMSIHFGNFFDDTSYKWGPTSPLEDVGKLNIGVTYRMGEWTNSMDLLFRGEYQTFRFENDQKASKVSLMPMISFPDAASKFPIYFGVGAGVGILFKQLDEESSISFDYQIVGGARVFNVLDTIGFFIEAGVKNHVLLLTSGQFNGVAISFGTVFVF